MVRCSRVSADFDGSIRISVPLQPMSTKNVLVVEQIFHNHPLLASQPCCFLLSCNSFLVFPYRCRSRRRVLLSLFLLWIFSVFRLVSTSFIFSEQLFSTCDFSKCTFSLPYSLFPTATYQAKVSCQEKEWLCGHHPLAP